MKKEQNCLISLCNNKTENDCINRNLFGAPAKSAPYLKDVKKGDIGFLLNYNEDILIGIFNVQSESMHMIDSEAFNGYFPIQTRVKPIGNLERLKNASAIFRKVGINTRKRQKTGRVPIPEFSVYSNIFTERLLAHFKETNTIKTGTDTTSEVNTTNGSSATQEQELLIHDKSKFNDVVGLDKVKTFIKKRMVDPVLDIDTAQEYYLRLGGGLLLYGPPGTGKTLIAQATAGEIDAQFFELSPSIIQGFPGQPEKKLEKIFNDLLHLPRAVVFLDEAEALLASRDKQQSSVMQRITPVLLAQFARLSRNRFKPILIIAATNKPWGIDNAFLRPGRLDQILYIGLPNTNDRINLLNLFLQKRSRHCVDESFFTNKKHIELIANKLNRYSCADIEQIIDEAAHNAYTERKKINLEIIESVVERSNPSVNKDQARQIEEWGNKLS